MKIYLLAFLAIILLVSGCSTRAIQQDASRVTSQSIQSETATQKLDDEHFIGQTYGILQRLEVADVDKERMTVTRQKSESHNRSEVIVTFSQNGHEGNATFNEKTGVLLDVLCFDFEFSELQDYNLDAAEEKAKEYYELLPVPQGYFLTDSYSVTEGIGGICSYRFSRLISEGVYNQYEQVIISIDTDNGHFQMCVVHDFPLADEQNENEKVLTQDEAHIIAQALIFKRWPDWQGELIAAEITVVLPNRRFTEQDDGTLKYPENSYLAWQMTYENKHSETSDMLKIYVDLYNGDLLGGDSTGLV